jgi:hypothetical protein
VSNESRKDVVLAKRINNEKPVLAKLIVDRKLVLAKREFDPNFGDVVCKIARKANAIEAQKVIAKAPPRLTLRKGDEMPTAVMHSDIEKIHRAKNQCVWFPHHQQIGSNRHEKGQRTFSSKAERLRSSTQFLN